MWYRETIGKNRCPIVDTWWQTETGRHHDYAPTRRDADETRFRHASFPRRRRRYHEPRRQAGRAKRGWIPRDKAALAVMLRTIWGDDERYRQQYWAQIDGIYFAGDGARRDSDGYFWIMGRIDDVINVSGHRLGTAEIESALVSHPAVAEAAVVARPDELKGSGIVAFVTLEGSQTASEELNKELRGHVVKEIGALARPDEIRFTDALPKTRSGKIMRRLLREIATSGTVVGDVTTLEDFSVLEKLREDEE
jgi:acetyl-CoA synthetase